MEKPSSTGSRRSDGSPRSASAFTTAEDSCTVDRACPCICARDSVTRSVINRRRHELRTDGPVASASAQVNA